MCVGAQAGVECVLQCLREELLFTMRLMGTTSVAGITPDAVIARNLGDHVGAAPKDYLALRTYEALRPRM
jgi:isopentenyl diphosphate isomerase/L-lactate dehydrogenase-like FMN-dependent dehydrogenase